MSRLLEDQDITRALRDGLQAQPVPQPGSDFDERVLGVLRDRGPWWRSLWFSMRPIISTAACSLIVMLVVLHWSLQPPTPASNMHPTQVTAPQASQAGITMAMLDKALDRPDLRFGTFALILDRYQPDTAVGPPAQPPRRATGRPPGPPKRDGLALHRDPFLA